MKLLEELEKYVEDMAVSGLKMLRHPLVYQVPFMGSSIEIEHANKFYSQKVLMLNAAIAAKNLHRAIFLYERPYRLEAFLNLAENELVESNQKEFWELLGHIWIDSENNGILLNTWRGLFEDAELTEASIHFMTGEEQKQHKELADQLTLYRGGDYDGLSYTLHKDKAIWFAKRYSNKKPQLFTRVVSKANTFALKTGRNESEIIINPYLLDEPVEGVVI